jgi:hypothetical protein
MPLLTAAITTEGAFVSVLVGPSAPRVEALQAAGRQVPAPKAIRALLDTGASCTILDATVVQALGLVPTGVTAISTPSTGDMPHLCNQYDAAVEILLEPPHVHLASRTIPVIEAPLAHLGLQALLGRDILNQGILIYNGKSAQFSRAF